MTQKILDAARSKGQGEADTVKSDGAKDIAAIDTNSAKNQDKAVTMVVDALMSE